MSKRPSNAVQAEDKFVYGPNWKLPTRIRAAGWVFLILGSVLLTRDVVITFTPTGYIADNHGLRTNDFRTKLVGLAPTAIPLIMGALFAFLPSEKLRFMVRPPNGGRRREWD